MPRYEFVEGSSSKFWEIEISGASVTTRWGRIGTAGQEKTKDFGSPAKAQAEYAALIREKTSKGYTLIGGAQAPAPAATAPLPGPHPLDPPLPSPPLPPGEGEGKRGTAEPLEVWTDALRRKLHPRRSSGVQARPRKPAEALARIRENWMSHMRKIWEISRPEEDALTHRAFLLACARLDELEEGAGAPPPPTDPDLESAFFALVFVRSTWKSSVDDSVVDYWVASQGPAFAVEALFGSLRVYAVSDGSGVELTRAVFQEKDMQLVEPFSRQRLERGTSHRGLGVKGFGDGILGAWGRLRRLLAGAGEAEWQAARDVAARLRQGANLLERIGLAFLFPDVPEWAAEDARDVLEFGSKWTPAGCLLASLRDGELLERLAFLLAAGFAHLPKVDDKQQHEDMAGLALAMAEGAGGAAVPALARFFETSWEFRLRRDCAEAVSVVQDERALAFLAAHAHLREAAPSLADAALRFPREALPALAAEVARGGKAAKACAPLLARLARQHDELAREILPDLPEASRRVIEPLLGKAVTDWTETPPEALPAVLARPPWTVKGKARAAGPVLRLDPIEPPDEMVWKEGQREEWLAMPIEGEEYARGDNAAVDFMGLAAVTPLAQDEAVLRHRIRQFATHTGFRGSALALMSERIAMIFWEEFPPGAWWIPRRDGFHRFIAKYELRILSRLIEMAASRTAQIFPFLLPFRSPRVARLAATSLEARAARPLAQRWLRTHTETAALALVPLAVGPAGREREAAGAALRFLAAEGQEDAVLAAAARYGDEAREAVAGVLAEDPLELFPAKLPKLPGFWQPEGFARPLLRDRRQALPLDAVEHLGTMLAFSRLDEPYAGLARVKDACDPASLAAFAWDLFQAWLDAGAPSKEAWAFQALAHLGDDGCVGRLVPKIREWPAQQGFARAVAGLDVLAALGSDVALMHLHGIAQKAKHKPLQERAEERVEEIAARRGLTAEDLADRLVPDLGLGADGSLTLDFGPRAFRVGFDEYLKPFMRDAVGKQLTDLPKPGKGDDAAAAAQAQEVWKGLKKNVKAVAAHQILRLELAMCRQRRWEPEVFRTFFVQHPLLQHLVRRLIWGVWDGENRLAGTFRVTEDGSFADAADDAWELPAGARIGVVHRLDLTDDLAARWGQVVADYEILQPFPQIGREVWRIEEAERDAKELLRHSGVTVHTGKVLGLDQRGWRRGPVLDGGIIACMELPVPGGKAAAEVWLDPGIRVGSVADEPEQTIQEVVLRRGSQWSEHKLPFGTLDPITFSELVRDLERLR